MRSRVPSGAHHFSAEDPAAGIGEQPLSLCLVDDDDVVSFRGRTQAVDQLAAGSARQTMHAQRRVSGIIEILDDFEWQRMAIREPFDQRRGLARDRLGKLKIDLAAGLALDVVGEELRTVDNALGALEARASGRNEPCRQSGRTARHRIAFDHDRVDAGFLRRERRANSSGAGADDQQRHLRIPCGGDVEADFAHSRDYSTRKQKPRGLSDPGAV